MVLGVGKGRSVVNGGSSPEGVKLSGEKESAQKVDGLVLMASSKELSFCVAAFQSAATRRMHATPIW